MPQTGQVAGISYSRSAPVRRSTIGRTTSGMTSPAFWRTTQSPIRMSLRRTSSRLWRVARATVEPATLTGVMCATGVSVPVRPTYGTMSSTKASTCSGGNLKAIAQRGARLTIPSRACWSTRSTLTTTPSVSYGRSWRFSRQSSVKSMTPSMSRSAACSGLTGKPSAVEARQRLRLGRDRVAVLDQLVEPGRQLPTRRDLRVDLAERARAAVARVGVERQAGFLALLVDALELGLGHEHLAPRLERGGLLQPGRDDRDRLQVRGHVLAGRAVAAGRALDEAAALEAEADREAVDLELGAVAQVRGGFGRSRQAETLAHARVEPAQLVVAERVRQATASAARGGPRRTSRRSVSRRRAASVSRR